jgi:hypothetical protein
VDPAEVDGGNDGIAGAVDGAIAADGEWEGEGGDGVGAAVAERAGGVCGGGAGDGGGTAGGGVRVLVPNREAGNPLTPTLSPKRVKTRVNALMSGRGSQTAAVAPSRATIPRR